MILLDDFEELKRQVAEDERAYERVRGTVSQLLKQLEEEFGVKDLAAAERLWTEYKRKRGRAAEVYAARKKEYERERAEWTLRQKKT